MAKVRTLQDTKSMESKKIQGQGYRLGSAREQELEEALRDSTKSNSEITSEYKNMQVVYSNHTKNANKENDQLRCNNEKLSNHVYQLIDEVKRLRSEIDTLKSSITDKDLSLSNFKADIRTKSKEMKDFLSKMEALETKLSSAQKDLSMKESEIDPLKAELCALNSILVSKNTELVYMENALASKDDELKQMKDDLALKTSEIHSLESKLSSEPINIGGEADEKKILNSASQSDDAIASDISSKDLSQYFIHGKSMDQAGKIDAHQSSDIINKANDEAKPQIPDSLRSTNMKSSTSKDSHADNSQIVETKDFSEDTVSKTDFITHRVAPEGPGNDQSHTIKTEMAEILPVVGSNLFSPKFMYAVLAFLILAVIWFTVIKPIRDARKKDTAHTLLYH